MLIIRIDCTNMDLDLCCKNIMRFYAVLNISHPFMIKRLILNTAKSKHFRFNPSNRDRIVWMQ
jgi:hypothetical protein